MELSISPSNLLALIAATAVLAAVPSVSVLAVTARAAALGFRHGVYTALGIAAGDVVFILIAVFGLSALEVASDGLFLLIRVLGGLYLIVLGVGVWRRGGVGESEALAPRKSSWSGSFLSGFLLTLGDQKAILFYLGFLPGFVDLATATWADIGLIMACAVLSLAGVKIIYAGLAARAGARLGGPAGRWLSRAAGCVMVAVGVHLLFRP